MKRVLAASLIGWSILWVEAGQSQLIPEAVSCAPLHDRVEDNRSVWRR